MMNEIWDAMRDWKRPCEYGPCKYRKDDRCTVWDCIPELEEIKRVKEELENR